MTAWARTASVALLGLLAGCASSPARQGGAVGAEAYLLPWTPGRSHLCVQGGPGPFSHSDSMAHAVDFAMPVGTAVLASRAGRVCEVKEDSNCGGPASAYASHGNLVRIRHDDGTSALYLHLVPDGVLVENGERVAQGQVIARSGNTGWSAFPHLHFQVDAWQGERGWCSIPFHFADVPGGRPRMWRVYASGNRLQGRCGEPVR